MNELAVADQFPFNVEPVVSSYLHMCDRFKKNGCPTIEQVVTYYDALVDYRLAHGEINTISYVEKKELVNVLMAYYLFFQDDYGTFYHYPAKGVW